MTVEQLVEWMSSSGTEVLGRNCPSAALSTTVPTWLGRGSKPDRRGGKPEIGHGLIWSKVNILISEPSFLTSESERDCVLWRPSQNESKRKIKKYYYFWRKKHNLIQKQLGYYSAAVARRTRREEKSIFTWRKVSSEMLRRVALLRTDVSEKRSASFIRVTRIGEQGTTLAVTSNRACVGC
jgi:hypothetical protein